MSLLGLFFMVTGASRAAYEGIAEQSIVERNAREAKKKGAIAYPISSRYCINCYYLKGHGKVIYKNGWFCEPKTDGLVFGVDSAICILQEEILRRKSKELGLKGYINLFKPYTSTTEDQFLKRCRRLDNDNRYRYCDKYDCRNWNDKKNDPKWDGRLALTEEVKKEMIDIYNKGINFIFDGCKDYKDVQKMVWEIREKRNAEVK